MALQRLGQARLDFLDQMRAIAIITVIVVHYNSGWLPGGSIGVGIFFALSGFLIATILLEEKNFGPDVAVKFIIRRFMRIYPAYLIAILTTVTLTYFKKPEKLHDILAAVPGLLTFTQEVHFIGYAFSVLWTLQIEMAFYLIVPIVMVILGRKPGLLVVSVAMIAASGLVFAGFRSISPIQNWSGALAFGSLVGLAWKCNLLERLPIKPVVLAGTGLLGIAVLLYFPPSSGLIWMIECFSASLCGCGLIVAFLLDPSLPVMPGTPWIGQISYSIYLVHGIVLDFYICPAFIFDRIYWLHHSWNFAQFGTFLTVVISISAVSYYWIEKPGIRIGKLLTSTISRLRPAMSGAN